MAHLMESNDIQHGISVAWHKLTKVKTSEELARDGFPFELVRKPVLVEGNETGWQWLAGSDDNALIAAPFNPDTYSVLSNARFLDIVKNALSGTKATIESLGTFGGRSKRYVTVKVGEDFEQFRIGKREFFNRLNLHDAVDRSMPLIAKAANTCIVCANTFAMSLAERGDFKLSLRHTSGMDDKIANFEKAIESYRGVTALYRELFEHADTLPVSDEVAHLSVLGFLSEGKETSTRTRNQAERIQDLFNAGAGNNGRTALDLISAVTDYYSHESSGKKASAFRQFESSEIGAGAVRKAEFVAAIQADNGREIDAKRIDGLARLGKQALELTPA